MIGIKEFLTISLLLLISVFIIAQKPAYTLFNAKGKKVSYQKMLKKIAKKDIVLFGEIHNNPIAHWLQYELTSDLFNKRLLILGAEMIEADNQEILNNYLIDSINFSTFDSLARLWINYKTDYAPLVDFAKKTKLPFVATNIPRRYANMVYKKGFKVLDSLSSLEKKWIAPLPILFDSELPTYKNILSMMGAHGSQKLVKAQAMKDATMAFFILENYKKKHLFIHYNGSYHSDNYEGILWYLKKKKPDLQYLTIGTVSQKNLHKLDKKNLHIADFIICVDHNMTTTY